MLPGNFAPWKTIYYYFSVWKKGEIFEIIHEALVEKARVMQGKKEEPTVKSKPHIINPWIAPNNIIEFRNPELKGIDVKFELKYQSMKLFS